MLAIFLQSINCIHLVQVVYIFVYKGPLYVKICKCKCLCILERWSFAKGFLNMWHPKYENQKSWIIECRCIFYDVFLSFLELDWCGHYKLLLNVKCCITILQKCQLLCYIEKKQEHTGLERPEGEWMTELSFFCELFSLSLQCWLNHWKKNWQVVNAGYIRPKGERPTMQQLATFHWLWAGARLECRPQIEVASGAQFVMPELPESW